MDRSAVEFKRRDVGARHRLAEVAAHADAAAGQPERERVGLDPGEGGHLGAVDVEGGVTDRGVRALDDARAGVADAEDVPAGRQGVGCDHPLFGFAEEVVDELQSAVGNEEHVAAVPGALLEQDALGARAVEIDLGQHGEGAPGDHHARTHRDRRGVRVVDEPVAVADERRPPAPDHLEDVEVGQRKPVVLPRLGEPQGLQFGELVRVLGGHIVTLAPVVGDVVELPAVLVEVRPARRGGGVHGVGEPAVVPDAAGAQHGVELGVLSGVGARIIQCRFETHALQRLLGDTAHRLRRGDTEQLVDRRGDVADVDVVVPDLAVRRNPVGPRDDCGVGDTPLVGGITLVQLVGRVEGHRPADRIVVVGGRTAQHVEEAHAVLDRVDVAVEELGLVHRTVGATLAAGAVVGDHHDDGVVELA